jgi:hypothetical protein
VFARLNQFWDTSHIYAYDRPPQSHRFHNDHRQALREASQHKGARSQNFVIQLLASYSTHDAHFFLQVVVRDQCFDFPAHFAIANKDEIEIRSARCKTTRGVH